MNNIPSYIFSLTLFGPESCVLNPSESLVLVLTLVPMFRIDKPPQVGAKYVSFEATCVCFFGRRDNRRFPITPQ